LFLTVLFPGELFGALRGRLLDSNKNIVMASLTAIGNVASAMGQAVEKASKVSGFCSVFVFFFPIWYYFAVFCLNIS